MPPPPDPGSPPVHAPAPAAAAAAAAAAGHRAAQPAPGRPQSQPVHAPAPGPETKPDTPAHQAPPPRPLIDPAARPWLDIDGERYPLLGPLTVIGRDTTADVVIDDPGISRRHSEIRVTNDGPHLVASIRDLSSTNGTFVNGERITSTRLVNGDRLTVGRTSVTFRAGKR